MNVKVWCFAFVAFLWNLRLTTFLSWPSKPQRKDTKVMYGRPQVFWRVYYSSLQLCWMTLLWCSVIWISQEHWWTINDVEENVGCEEEHGCVTWINYVVYQIIHFNFLCRKLINLYIMFPPCAGLDTAHQFVSANLGINAHKHAFYSLSDKSQFIFNSNLWGRPCGQQKSFSVLNHEHSHHNCLIWVFVPI